MPVDLAKLPQVEVHVSRQGDWWEIEASRKGSGRWHIVRRCKGDRAAAEACTRRYLKTLGDNLAVIKWYD